MRAVIASRPGGPGVLEIADLPDPEPAADEVRIRVEAASVTFFDTMVRSGSQIGPRTTFPVVLGNGVGGVVDAVGPEADTDWLDRRVVATTGGTGGYASLALAPAAALHRVPKQLDVATATALLADGRTAVGLHEAAGVKSSDAVVITAAAGGLGSLLVQLAKGAGARVIALVGSDVKLQHARELGADIAVNYREDAWAHRVDEAAPHGVDVVFDGVGSDTTAILLARTQRNGRYLPHGAAGGEFGVIDNALVDERNIDLIPLSSVFSAPGAMARLTDTALILASQGTLQPLIGQTYPLEQAAMAHAVIAARTAIGKTLLTP